MGNLHVYATALAMKATISNVSSTLCVLFHPRELSKKVVPTRPSLQSSPIKETENYSLLSAKRLLIFNCSEPVPHTVLTRTETNFPLNVLLEDTSDDEDV